MGEGRDAPSRGPAAAAVRGAPSLGKVRRGAPEPRTRAGAVALCGGGGSGLQPSGAVQQGEGTRQPQPGEWDGRMCVDYPTTHWVYQDLLGSVRLFGVCAGLAKMSHTRISGVPSAAYTRFVPEPLPLHNSSRKHWWQTCAHAKSCRDFLCSGGRVKGMKGAEGNSGCPSQASIYSLLSTTCLLFVVLNPPLRTSHILHRKLLSLTTCPRVWRRVRGLTGRVRP